MPDVRQSAVTRARVTRARKVRGREARARVTRARKVRGRVLRARVRPELYRAVADLAGGKGRISRTLRELVIEGLRRRGRWPCGGENTGP